MSLSFRSIRSLMATLAVSNLFRLLVVVYQTYGDKEMRAVADRIPAERCPNKAHFMVAIRCGITTKTGYNEWREAARGATQPERLARVAAERKLLVAAPATKSVAAWDAVITQRVMAGLFASAKK